MAKLEERVNQVEARWPVSRNTYIIQLLRNSLIYILHKQEIDVIWEYRKSTFEWRGSFGLCWTGF